MNRGRRRPTSLLGARARRVALCCEFWHRSVADVDGGLGRVCAFTVPQFHRRFLGRFPHRL